jgi:predicted metal-dependent phosphoesterase TrpH
LRIDLHVHTVFSPDSLLQADVLVQIAVKKKIDCIAVTDHNTISGALHLIKMAPPFRVIIGEEILTSEGEVIGLFLKEEIPAGLSARETIQLIRKQQGLVVLPHPCDRLRHHALASSWVEEVLPEVDLVEGFNGRTVFPKDDQSAVDLGERFHKSIIAGSDSHTSWEFGRVGMEMGAFENPMEFMSEINNAKFFGHRTPPWIHLVTKSVKYANRIGLRRYQGSYTGAKSS